MPLLSQVFHFMPAFPFPVRLAWLELTSFVQGALLLDR